MVLVSKVALGCYVALLYTVLQFVSVREPTPTLTPQIKSGLVAAHLERH